jgi:hypothetical protein
MLLIYRTTHCNRGSKSQRISTRKEHPTAIVANRVEDKPRAKEPDCMGRGGKEVVPVGVGPGMETVGVGTGKGTGPPDGAVAGVVCGLPVPSYVTMNVQSQVELGNLKISAISLVVQMLPSQSFWLRKKKRVSPSVSSEGQVPVLSTLKAAPPASAQVLAKFWSPFVDQEEMSTVQSLKSGHSEARNSSKSD